MSSDTQNTWTLDGKWTPELLAECHALAQGIARIAVEGEQPHLAHFAAMADALANEVERLQAGIREHRDQRGDDRCWEDDARLYAVLGEGDGEADSALPPKAEFLKSCERFYEQRQCPATAGQRKGMTIAQLEAEVERLREYEWMYKDLCK
jgi:hypothetical protein